MTMKTMQQTFLSNESNHIHSHTVKYWKWLICYIESNNKQGIIVSELQDLSLFASVAFRDQWVLFVSIIDPSLHFDNYLM